MQVGDTDDRAEIVALHTALHSRCAVCKSTDPGPTLILKPHDTLEATVFIHVRCMGGLPLIAVKWHLVSASHKQDSAEATLWDFLTAWPAELVDFEENDT